MFIVMDQLDHSSYPQVPNIVWPKQHQSIRKSKSFMHHCLFACLFIHLLIYLFWIYQCAEVLHDALSRESIKPVFFSQYCLLLAVCGCQVYWLLAIWCSLGFWVFRATEPSLNNRFTNNSGIKQLFGQLQCPLNCQLSSDLSWLP